MNLTIKIIRNKNNNDKHEGTLHFGSDIIIPFSVTDNELKDIHFSNILRDTQTAIGENIYQATFTIIAD